MNTNSKHIVLLAITLVICMTNIFAQSGLYVPQNGKIFFTGGNATVFSNVQNNGNIGVGKNAVVNFSGKQWSNDAQALITDESYGGAGVNGNGGVVRFLSSDTIPQQLNGGYNMATRKGAAFSKLQIESKAGVVLSGGNTKVRQELTLSKGLLFVKENMLIVGNSNPGTIKGYDSLHYIVTDDMSNEGFLLREGITEKDGRVVFPVGSSQHAYSPMAIRSFASQADNYYVNVADGVKTDVLRGEFKKEGVNKTWQAGKQLRPNQDLVEVTLEHLNNEEGSFFISNRKNAYVSQYVQKVWDEGYPQNNPLAGNLTTGNASVNSGVNSRIFDGTISSASFFTKLSGKGDTAFNKTRVMLKGYRIDDELVNLNWKTNPEVNNHHFVIQRMLSNEAGFKTIDSVATRAISNSYKDLNYELKDKITYTGNIYYRLILVDRNNDTTYSNTIAVGVKPGPYKLLLWPNPTPERFNIGISGEIIVKTLVIWNAIGQKVYQQEVNGRTIMEVRGFIPGTYMVGFISHQGQIIETKRVVVLGY